MNIPANVLNQPAHIGRLQAGRYKKLMARLEKMTECLGLFRHNIAVQRSIDICYYMQAKEEMSLLHGQLNEALEKVRLLHDRMDAKYEKIFPQWKRDVRWLARLTSACGEP